ncbi:MAG: hypothetical protein MSF32_07440 [Dysosmobacter sp.]|nr:hypothetical protein [Dysosmobacter sp.]
MKKNKILALVLACVICVGIGIGGTLAWLTATTGDVTNTFTTSDIDITLAETKTDFKMVPGCTIEKDPKVTVKAGSEACYLFVKIEESEDAKLSDYIAYAVASGWEKLTGVEGVNNVWYKTITTATTSDTAYDILGAGTYTENSVTYSWNANQVLVKPSVTKKMMNDLTDATRPTLKFTAYASQYMKNNTEHFEAADAWANISTLSTP